MSNSISQAAIAIQALINSKPMSPRLDELEAIITKAMASENTPPALRAEFDQARTTVEGAETDQAVSDEAESIAGEALEDVAWRILRGPVHTSAGLALAAEAAFWILYTNPCHLMDPRADAVLADGVPYELDASMGGVMQEVLVAILRAIRTSTKGAGCKWRYTEVPFVPADIWRNNYVASDWHRIVTAFLDASGRPENDGDEGRDALNAQLAHDTEAILARPVSTWADLIQLAAIAVHWNSPVRLVDSGYPDDIIASDEAIDERVLAHVVRGILKLSGMKFDAEGRLLPQGA